MSDTTTSMSRSRSAARRTLLLTIGGAIVLGAALVLSPVMAFGVIGLGAFVLLWFGPRWGILVVPVAWMLAGDPVLIQLTGAAASRPFYLAMDGWTLLALTAFFASAVLRDKAALRVLRSPFGVGVLGMWCAFAVSQLAGGGLGASLGAQWGDARGIVYAGWLLVSSYIYLTTRSKGAEAVLVLAAGGVFVKGLIFYATGIGLRGATYVAGYRAFGSEETTVGLILLAVGLAVIGNPAVRRPWALVAFSAGVVIVLLGALRAYWLASVGVVVALVVLQSLRSARRSAKILAWLGIATGVVVLILATVANRFYQVTLAKRLATVLGGTRAARGDVSLGYRFVELFTVTRAVGRSVVFGAGLGATHRGVLIYNPSDLLQQALLPAYVHNSFLWSYLKAGLLGVAGCASYYVGTIVEPIRVLRRKPTPLVRDLSLAFAVVAGSLIFVGLFNALVASARYELNVALAFGWFFGLAHREEPVADGA